VQPASVAVGFTLFVIYSFWSVVLAGGGHGWERTISFALLLAAHPARLVPIFIGHSGCLGASGISRHVLLLPEGLLSRLLLGSPACAIAEPKFRHHYNGERGFPLILNNFHRFFLYLALIVLAFLWVDTVRAFYYNAGCTSALVRSSCY
jgi:hypothetical protein